MRLLAAAAPHSIHEPLLSTAVSITVSLRLHYRLIDRPDTGTLAHWVRESTETSWPHCCPRAAPGM